MARDVTQLSCTVFCCQDGDCKKNGAKEVLKALRAEVKDRGLGQQVAFVKTECTGQCKEAPIAIVCSGCTLGAGGVCGAVWYRKIKPDDAPALVAEHVQNGRPVSEKRFKPTDK